MIGVLSAPLEAHEFWLDPTRYMVDPGAPLIANIRNGENFKGRALPYLEVDIARFDLIIGDVSMPVEGRLGDIPALEQPAREDGLVVIVHQTTPSLLTYRGWEKFQKFADHKDFPGLRERHDARGLPVDKFKESYTRYAKALVGVGGSAGQDRETGMETEFVAIDNPYLGTPETLRFRLLYQQAPRVDAQVEVFDRAPDGTVSIHLYRTNDAGEVEIPVISGHNYLLDSVVLREMPDGSDAVWETLWAAMTFAVP
ncbi:MAG: DUF4198 domain-containing protein [Paracoccaceae bacterium]